ncbi:unnamed protein product [Closterium sp. NIES-54]
MRTMPLSPSCRPPFQPPYSLCDLSSMPTGLMDRLTEIHEENDTLSLLPFLLRPPPPFFSRWLHSTAASAFLRPALPHACFSFRPGAVAPPVLGLQGFALQGVGSVHGTEGSGRPGLVAQDDGEWQGSEEGVVRSEEPGRHFTPPPPFFSPLAALSCHLCLPPPRPPARLLLLPSRRRRPARAGPFKASPCRALGRCMERREGVDRDWWHRSMVSGAGRW